MKFEIDHLSRYTYSQPVSFGEQSLCLRLREGITRRVLAFSLETEPAGTLRWVQDCFNNTVAVFHYGLETSSSLSFRCRMEVEVQEENPFDFILEPRATGYPFRYDEKERGALAAYLISDTGSGNQRVLDWFYGAVKEPNTSTDIIGFLTDINQAIRRDIAYQRRDEEGIQTPDDTLAWRSGSCRDMAQLFLVLCRQLGLAARFVSGYLFDPPVGEDGEGLFNRARGSMHAWAEIYLPGAGWRGFDPTNGILANHYFLPSAVANEARWINPIQGKYYAPGPVKSSMEVSLEIREVTDE